MECQQQRKEKNSKNSYLIVLFFQFYSTEGHTKVDKLYVGSCLEFLLGIKTLFYTDREIVLQSFFFTNIRVSTFSKNSIKYSF